MTDPFPGSSDLEATMAPMETLPAPAPVCAPASESKRPPCDACGQPMEPEHAHDRCPACGYILPCCGW
jgi:hypothetical protein